MNSVLEALLKGESVRKVLGESRVGDPKFVAWVQDQALRDFELPLEYRSGSDFIEVVGNVGGDVTTQRYFYDDFKSEVKEANEDDYISCDGCGKENTGDFTIFAMYQFCPVCYHRLKTYLPKAVLDFCRASCDDDKEVAHFVLSVADGTYFN